jgi:hypothetical protein
MTAAPDWNSEVRSIDGRDRPAAAAPDLGAMLAAVLDTVPSPSPSQADALDRLKVLRDRLGAGRFQVAALGQFKRGKSTLLNALLGLLVLPVGVVPVTAVPTFLEAGPAPRLRITRLSGTIDDVPVDTVEEVRKQLEVLVTEHGNPGNSLAISRVVVTAPSDFLGRGVVLIDTPGVGSTFRHNTATADATLPECDACLFVVSPDPPITDVEVSYLSRVRQHMARVIVVLNKVDILEKDDRAATLEFLRDVLADRCGLAGAEIFPVSARAAQRATAAGDMAALKASGLPALEAHLADLLVREKQTVLRQAVARKAAVLVDDIMLDMRVGLEALRLPASELEQRIATFADAMPRFHAERQTAHDLLAGDRTRAVQFLETTAGELRTEALTMLREELDRMLAAGTETEAVRATLVSEASAFFNANVARFSEAVRSHVASVLSRHQARADDLIALVRRTAAELLDIPYRAPAADEVFAERHEPYWAMSGRTETVVPFKSGSLDVLFPARVRQARLKTRLLTEAEVLVTRNLENLRWAVLRNLDDAFRAFGSIFDERLAMTLKATEGAMQVGLDQGRSLGDRIGPELESREAALRRLVALEAELLSLAEAAA